MSLLRVLRGWIPRRRPAVRVPLVLYTRERCPLCETMRASIEAARLGERIELTVLDVDADPELQVRHGQAVPVLEIAGVARFVARLEPRELTLAVESASRALARGGR